MFFQTKLDLQLNVRILQEFVVLKENRQVLLGVWSSVDRFYINIVARGVLASLQSFGLFVALSQEVSEYSYTFLELFVALSEHLF